jgi:hypothetical protein
MDMPHPSSEQQALDLLIGNWLGQEKLYPSPFDPQGGAAIGRVRNYAALDGFAVIQDYEQERNGRVNFRGHGVFRWDVLEKCYLLHWFDSFGQAPVEYRGSLQGRILTLTSLIPGGFGRAIFDFTEPDFYQYRLEVSPDGQNWSVFTEGNYRRQGS